MGELKQWLVRPKVEVPVFTGERRTGETFTRVTKHTGQFGDMKAAVAALVEPIQALLDVDAGEKIGNLEAATEKKSGFLTVFATEETAEKIRALPGVASINPRTSVNRYKDAELTAKHG